ESRGLGLDLQCGQRGLQFVRSDRKELIPDPDRLLGLEKRHHRVRRLTEEGSKLLLANHCNRQRLWSIAQLAEADFHRETSSIAAQAVELRKRTHLRYDVGGLG